MLGGYTYLQPVTGGGRETGTLKITPSASGGVTADTVTVHSSRGSSEPPSRGLPGTMGLVTPGEGALPAKDA